MLLLDTVAVRDNRIRKLESYVSSIESKVHELEQQSLWTFIKNWSFRIFVKLFGKFV